ncbi:MAG: hypothetical protein ABI832_01740 [bacterium]
MALATGVAGAKDHRETHKADHAHAQRDAGRAASDVRSSQGRNDPAGVSASTSGDQSGEGLAGDDDGSDPADTDSASDTVGVGA